MERLVSSGRMSASPVDRLREAAEEFLQGNCYQAVRRIRRLVADEPDFTEALGHLSWLRRLQGNLPEAIQLLGELLEREPNNLEAARMRFDYALEAHDFRTAKDALATLPSDLQDEYQSRLEDRIQRCSQSELSAEDQGHLRLALLETPGRRTELLRDLYLKHPANVEAAYAFARYAGGSSRDYVITRADSIAIFRRLWKQSSHPDSVYMCAQLSLQTEDFETSLEATQYLLERNPNDRRHLTRLALLYEHTGNFQEAIRTCRNILRRDPDQKGVKANLFFLERSQGNAAPSDKTRLPPREDHPVYDALKKTRTTWRGDYAHFPYTRSRRGFFHFVSSPRDLLKRYVLPPKTMARIAVFRYRRNPNFRAVPCNLCGGAGFLGLARGMENKWPIVRCKNCGLIMVNPQPDESVLIGRYQESYYSEKGVETFRDIHAGAAIGEEPIVMQARIVRWLEERGLSEFEVSSGSKRMLDVGCGGGQLMRDFRNRGWISEGAEVSRPAIDMLQAFGYRVHHGVLSDLDLPVSTYDLIVMNHVIEHVLDPLGDLKRVYRLLRKGGWLFLTTPGADSIPARIAGAGWFYDPDHVFFFSREILLEMLREAGFEILAESSYVGAGTETWFEGWASEGMGPTATSWVEKANQGDVLMTLARKPD